MAVTSWNTTYGLWNDGTNWLGGIAPVAGDVAVINYGNAEPDLGNYGTLSGVTIDAVAGFKIDIANATGPTTFAADTVLNLDNSAMFTVADAGGFTNLGQVNHLSGGTAQWYLIPGGSFTSALNNYGTINISAPFVLMGMGDFMNAGLLQVRNVTGLANATLQIVASTQSLINTGTINIDGDLGATRGSTAATFGGVNGAGIIDLAFATLTFNGNVGSAQTLDFRDAQGSLVLNLGSSSFAATIEGFRAGDSIDLGAITADGLSFTPGGPTTPGTLTISNAGSPVATLNFAGSYQTADFTLGVNALAHEVLTSSVVPCFATGTCLLTGRGEIPVEALRVGDRLPTAVGRRLASVRWIGHRRVDCRRHPDPEAVLPVRVAAGAFGPGQPSRDLFLSRDHAIHAEGALIPVRHLLNGDSIAQVPTASVTWWHVELDAHDVLLAENLPCESYLDTGNRAAFANAGALVQATPDFARACWDSAACATLIEGGPIVDRLRNVLADRATATRPSRGVATA